MNAKDFWKEKILGWSIIVLSEIMMGIFLMPYGKILHPFIITYIFLVAPIGYGISTGVEFYKKKKFYETIKNSNDLLEEKYLLPAMIPKTDFIEGKILKEILEDADKAMLEKVNQYKHAQEEYKEYIELWIHEIKLPIATSKMIVTNNKNEVTKSMEEEINKIENYVEQALFYARSNAVEKDYYMKKVALKEIVNTVIRKNKEIILQKGIRIELDNLEEKVYTDGKWCEFILNQIITNSIQYSKQEGAIIRIVAQKKKEQVILLLQDNGAGIKKGEITRVFEKGFTGSNGRRENKKSTGIGLYLCKKLGDKLGIRIELNSEEKTGTEVKLVFPQNSYIETVK